MPTFVPSLKLHLQHASARTNVPTNAQFKRWARATLRVNTEVTIRLVDEAEGQALNLTYRGKDYATNVLTFVLTEAPDLIGDMVLCVPVIAREAAEQHKTLESHFAHLTVHSVLHLHGYDHEISAQAELMESLEVQILHKLGYANPYLVTRDT